MIKTTRDDHSETGRGPRVCLLFPRFEDGFVMRKVPLGLAYIASSLEEKGVEVDSFNLCVDPFDSIDLTRYAFFGMTCLTPFIKEIKHLSSLIKAANPRAKIVVGGTHATLATEHTLDAIEHVDYVVKGEGEEAFAELVTRESDHPVIPGIYYRGIDGRVQGTPKKVPNIHTLAYPNVGSFDHGNMEKRNPLRPILTSRGCPWSCKNCQPNLDIVQPYRLRKVDDVLQEIEFRQDLYDQTYFGFVDSEFPIRKEWFLKFYEEIRRRKIEFEFHCNTRSDLVDREIMEIYKDLKISRLAIGVESGVDRVVNGILDKQIDLERTRQVFVEAADVGIRTHAHFMIGMPGETLEDMESTLQYARSLKATSVEFNFLTPWPGTHFYDICIENDFLVQKDVDKFNEKHFPVIQTPDFSPEQVMDFYNHLRKVLVDDGWHVAPDGTVFYTPTYDGEDLAPPPAAREGTRKGGFYEAADSINDLGIML